jgi:hypothetical protein
MCDDATARAAVLPGIRSERDLRADKPLRPAPAETARWGTVPTRVFVRDGGSACPQRLQLVIEQPVARLAQVREKYPLHHDSESTRTCPAVARARPP